MWKNTIKKGSVNKPALEKLHSAILDYIHLTLEEEDDKFIKELRSALKIVEAKLGRD